MLHMKKNTKTKAGTLAATGLALASVLGLVHQGATASSSTAQSATLVQAQQPVATATVRTSTQSSATTAQPTSTAAQQSVKAAVTPVVNTRTHAS